MAGPEILPSGAESIDESTSRVTTPEYGSVESVTYSGPVAQIEAKEDELSAEADLLGNIASLEYQDRAGRATLRVNYRRLWLSVDPADQSVQELNSFDVTRPIYSAPYFATLTNAEIITVRDYFEQSIAAAAGWSALQNRLYGHLAHGQEVYYEPAYELVLTWTTTSTTNLLVASSNQNTVQTRPSLSGALSNLIDALPSGEWLKRPTQVTSIGSGRWQVRVTYQWAPAWSVIYGGTFTGA